MIQGHITSAMIHRISAIPWLLAIGEPYDPELTFKVKRVGSWARAIECYHDPDWEDATLDASNRLSSYIAEKNRQRFWQWNEIGTAAREVFLQYVNPMILKFQDDRGLDDILGQRVMWHVGHALIEDSYRDCRPPRFFLDLLEIYESGHLPCGWDGGAWPQGWLLVY